MLSFLSELTINDEIHVGALFTPPLSGAATGHFLVLSWLTALTLIVHRVFVYLES